MHGSLHDAHSCWPRRVALAHEGRLADHPPLGKSGRIPGTRELIPHESYSLVYEVDGETVWILALLHTARLWP
jgi:plasmid stabilization system protein ParE